MRRVARILANIGAGVVMLGIIAAPWWIGQWP